ncbi:type ISP restriction/modification enzyme [Herpetosiphon sp. NSE202]|uniref:type ISP restriction/modification enzyme n=1 Tax=Herpetosiphon sp. NSE202 TaxID=3351349 RepID=UPI00363CE1B1
MTITTFLNDISKLLKTSSATEHSYRPALQALFQDVLKVEAINEPKHEKYGAPDFVIMRGAIPIGHVEAKNIGIKLESVIRESEEAEPKTKNAQQLQRYRSALPNLLYTDGLVWYWFRHGVLQNTEPVILATWNDISKKLIQTSTGINDLLKLLAQFGNDVSSNITNPRDLAERLARIAQWLRDDIQELFKEQTSQGSLHQQLEAFRKTLLPGLKSDRFADMYAQTIVYGLFAARVAQPTNTTFSRFDAAQTIPKTNPFLRSLFQQIAGYDLDERIAWLVDDCAALLAYTNMTEVMRDFGRATRQEDPVFHFYETFLAAYNPKMRAALGVYYTPEPVVSFMVHAIHRILQTEFNKPMGLADENTIILDPAAGTATFLNAVIQKIHQEIVAQGLAGTWDQYVTEKLLNRVFGFELLMSPYTIAHLKLSLILKELGYTFGTDKRLGVYLTDTLANAPSLQQAFAFGQTIAEEGHAANDVKHNKNVMVILGNPPYSKSSKNQGSWIEGLMDDYKKTVRSEETQIQALSDDYAKFIRFGHWRIKQSNSGILALITNNGYLDGPIFRDMRRSLLDDFDEIIIINLGGDSKKNRGSSKISDQNVFNIQQGVCISLFIKNSKEKKGISYYEITGDRNSKYELLNNSNIEFLAESFIKFTPKEPNFLFIPLNFSSELNSEFQEYRKLHDIFGTGNPKNDNHNLYGTAFLTQQDSFAISFDIHTLQERMKDFISNNNEEEMREKYNLCTTNQWNYDRAKSEIPNIDILNSVKKVAYRPFDFRYTIFDRNICTIIRKRITDKFNNPNIALLTTRRITRDPFNNIFVADSYPEYKIVSHDRNTSVFPLYIYTENELEQARMPIELNNSNIKRRSNFNITFIRDFANMINLTWVEDGKGDLVNTFGPEDIFHYIYAIFHSPIYRHRYVEFLKMDFPRLPLTKNKNLFSILVELGAQLVDLHLLRLPGSSGIGGAGGVEILNQPSKQGISFPIGGSSLIEKVTYLETHDGYFGEIQINAKQKFIGIDPETWNVQIGGYKPLEKWLKDRKGRTLSTNDITHYLRIIIALRETRRLMSDIDKAIGKWPIE